MTKQQQPQVRNRFSKIKRVPLMFPETGKTKPEFKDSCDVKKIIDRYHRTGQVPLNTKNPIYGDFSKVQDYQQAMNTVILAQEQFESLPSQIRKKFNNNPEEFLNYMEENDGNMEKLALETGLLVKKQNDKSRKTEAVEPKEKPVKTEGKGAKPDTE